MKQGFCLVARHKPACLKLPARPEARVVGLSLLGWQMQAQSIL